MKKMFRKVQFLSNIATIVIAVLLAFVIVKQSFFQSAPPETISAVKTIRTPNQPVSMPANKLPASPLGKSIPINGIDWKKNKKTLVVYISSTCRFCKESEPFYKRFLKEHSTGDVKFMAVSPQSVEESRDYLKNSGIDIDEVYNAQFGSIGVTGTPTLLLVDENGTVSDVWKGKLSGDKESEVMSKLTS